MVQVELFGIARNRAGVAEASVEAESLGEVLEMLARRFPDLAETCFNHGRLKRGFIANLNGDRFISDPRIPIRSGDSLLILSADAGG